jgi:hypothetical protein
LSGLDTLLPDAELPASLLRAARSFAVASIVFVGIIFARFEQGVHGCGCRIINNGCEVVL